MTGETCKVPGEGVGRGPVSLGDKCEKLEADTPRPWPPKGRKTGNKCPRATQGTLGEGGGFDP